LDIITETWKVQNKRLNVVHFGMERYDYTIRIITISNYPSHVIYLTKNDLGLGKSGSI
jgi:DNA polymerase III delta prime subunit